MVRNTRGNFKPEARIYSRDEYANLTPAQKSQVHELKVKSGWIDGRTPPPGFQVNESTGEIEPTSQLVSTIRAATSNVRFHDQGYDRSNTSLPPPIRLVGDSVNGSIESPVQVQVGSTFGRSGRRQPHSNSSTISSVTVNGKPYQGHVFDEKGNRLS